MVLSPSSLIACLSIVVHSIPIEEVYCMSYNPWQDWVLVCNVDVVVC